MTPRDRRRRSGPGPGRRRSPGSGRRNPAARRRRNRPVPGRPIGWPGAETRPIGPASGPRTVRPGRRRHVQWWRTGSAAGPVRPVQRGKELEWFGRPDGKPRRESGGEPVGEPGPGGIIQGAGPLDEVPKHAELFVRQFGRPRRGQRPLRSAGRLPGWQARGCRPIPGHDGAGHDVPQALGPGVEEDQQEARSGRAAAGNRRSGGDCAAPRRRTERRGRCPG